MFISVSQDIIGIQDILSCKSILYDVFKLYPVLRMTIQHIAGRQVGILFCCFLYIIMIQGIQPQPDELLWRYT